MSSVGSFSVCGKLLKGLDLNCIDFFNKYYQNIVLINKADVQTFFINSTEESHNMYFNLKPGKTGYLFSAGEAGSSMTASFDKIDDDGVVYYKHNVQIPVVGVSQNIKTLLKQLDKSNYFAAIQFKDGSVEIFGFNNGLKTVPYSYEAQSSLGGSNIPMESRFDEYEPPYIYKPIFIHSLEGGWEGQAVKDFDNLFSNIPNVDIGDFNDDFNNDFYIG